MEQGCFVGCANYRYEDFSESRTNISPQALGNGSRSDDPALGKRLAPILQTRCNFQLSAGQIGQRPIDLDCSQGGSLPDRNVGREVGDGSDDRRVGALAERVQSGSR
jgi:hypothetical protein